jgi:flagellar basal body-associated protein FliL
LQCYKKLKIIFYITMLFLLSASLFISPALCSSQDEAESAIKSAENAVLDCYKAVFKAEKAGANVSSLLRVLNEAGWLLSKARVAYNNGDFQSAYEYAAKCTQKLDGRVDEANRLKLEAENARRMDFLVNYVGSSVGAVAIVVGGYAFWVFLKKREKTVEA